MTNKQGLQNIHVIGNRLQIDNILKESERERERERGGGDERERGR